MNTTKNMKWTAFFLCCAIVIPLLLNGCSMPIITDKEIDNGPYPAEKNLPKIIYEYRDPDDCIGSMNVSGSEKQALKAAARLGARYVMIQPTVVDYEVPVYETYRDGDWVNQRIIYYNTKSVPGHQVIMYR